MPRRIVVPPKYRVAKAVKKATTNPRGVESGFGQVESTTAGSQYPTVNVYLNGNTSSTVPARYSKDYSPETGDQVLMLNLGSDSRLRQQWVVVFAFA